MKVYRAINWHKITVWSAIASLYALAGWLAFKFVVGWHW
jgi:hypothetical protein